MNVDTDRRELRELDQRSESGLEVTLLWSERTGSLFVCIDDRSASTGFHFAVDPADALAAFRHPYGFAPRQDPGSASRARTADRAAGAELIAGDER